MIFTYIAIRTEFSWKPTEKISASSIKVLSQAKRRKGLINGLLLMNNEPTFYLKHGFYTLETLKKKVEELEKKADEFREHL